MNDYTEKNGKNGRNPFAAVSEGTLGKTFLDGMLRYACNRREQAKTLCVLAAAGVCGIAAGVLCFLVWGTRADLQTFRDAYLSARAFSAYENAGAYLRYFSGWFCHYAAWLCGALLCAGTFHPFIHSSLLCFARGLLSGFGVCALSGRFSGFCVFYAAAECAFLCLCGMVAAKSVLYVRRRNRKTVRDGIPSGTPRWDAAWLAGDLLPLLCGTLTALGTLVCGLLVISGASAIWLK